MGDGVRLIVASTQSEFVSHIKNGLVRKPCIESIIAVSKTTEVENKLSRQHRNILLLDADTVQASLAWVNMLHGRHSVFVIHTSAKGAYSFTVLKSGDDEFVLKPQRITTASGEQFTLHMYKQIENYIKRQRPPAMRDIIRMIGEQSKQKIVAIGSSTGGTNALESLLKALPADIPPMVVVQHMPSGFTKLFADRLNALYKQEIREAISGDYLMQGRMLLAPADRHMKLVRRSGRLAVECFVGNKIHGVMPAADVLFESVADTVKSAAVGVILTGMGSDGAKGLMKMHNAGAKTIGQDEASSVIYGMPKAAKDIGAVDYELHLDKIPEMILNLAKL